MGKRLFIAEKPDMGQQIARFLSNGQANSKKQQGYVDLNNDIVTWCVGHILSTAPPEHYKKDWAKWTMEGLPIIPDQWSMLPIKSKKKQIDTIKKLVHSKEVDTIINAGDPGREGQLIVDEILEFCNNKKPVQRINLSSLDNKSIQKALDNLEDNKKYYDVYCAGIGRMRADWLIGMNMTRAYTLMEQKKGNKGVFTVGRVQSPTLALVVKRDREIKNFVPKDYWTIEGDFIPEKDQQSFKAKWYPNTSQKDQDWVEGEKIWQYKKAEEIVNQVNQQKGSVVDYNKERKQEMPPLPFDLSNLQVYANNKFGLSIKQTLDICQSLYEKKLLSYPRTDSQYLPENLLSDASQVLEAISGTVSDLATFCDQADPNLKSKAWNDKKVGEHYGIIPTIQSASNEDLSSQEKQIYKVCAQRYIAQFLPPCEVDKVRIELDVSNQCFIAHGKTIQKMGWRILYQNQDNNKSDKEDTSQEDNNEDGQEDEEQADADVLLPELDKGSSIFCNKAYSKKQQTKPPAYFTQGSLITAMKNVHLHVDDPSLKKKLKNLEGIGRSATRAAIIENLLKRNLLATKSKKIIATEQGCRLVDSLPSKLVDPALTAMWETSLDGISAGKIDFDQFYDKQLSWIKELVGNVQNNYNQMPDQRQQNKPKPKSTGKTCPKCGEGELVERKSKKGSNAGSIFYGCNRFPECKYIENPDKKSQKSKGSGSSKQTKKTTQ